MVSRNEKRMDSVCTESNYSSDEEDYEMDSNDDNNNSDSDYEPVHKPKISTKTLYNGGKGKTVSPFCLDKQFQQQQHQPRRGPKPKVFSRNALMARENRIKKKMYLENLETKLEKYGKENRHLNGVIRNQNTIITNLKKEVKYLKNVLANSSDITKILKGIQKGTGMPVTTSLNKNLTVKEEKTETKLTVNKNDPWLDETIEDSMLNQEYSPLLMQDSLLTSESLFNFDNAQMEDVFSCVSARLDTEHNYTAKYNLDSDIDEESAGICLHIAKHKVSLEFCSECNQRANDTWTEVESCKNEDGVV